MTSKHGGPHGERSPMPDGHSVIAAHPADGYDAADRIRSWRI
ncbi:hypothetical protein AB0D14_39595 [Streptomyces sp. NPDC048484]